MSPALETVLARAGLHVTATEFLSLIEDAARRLTPPHADPARYFTRDQRATLAEVGMDLQPIGDGDMDPRARTVAEQAVLRDTALTVQQAAERLSVDTSRIRHRIAAGHLVGWKDRGGWRMPAWQFTESGVLPGLETVLPEIPSDQPALVVAAFMTTPQDDLLIEDQASTPRQWLLARGDPAKVAKLASTLGTPM